MICRKLRFFWSPQYILRTKFDSIIALVNNDIKNKNKTFYKNTTTKLKLCIKNNVYRNKSNDKFILKSF